MTDPAQPVEATPETDALFEEFINAGGEKDVIDYHAIMRKLDLLARSLERRLTVAKRQLYLAQTEIKEYQAKHTGIMRETDRRYDELVQDIEQGFMQGAYARLKNLQVAERKLTEAQSRIAELEKDAERLTWLEDHHTLHTQVDILYIVDGYQVTLMHEDGFTTLSPAYEGHDLRSAIDAAFKARA